MNYIRFQLVTPEKTVLSQELVSLTCPTTMGQITILPGHAPLVATLVPGELHAKTATDESFIFVAGGFVEVKENNKIVVLADAAEHHYDIDTQKAEEAKQKAEMAMKETKLSSNEYAKVAASLEQNLAKLHIARRHAHRRSSTLDQNTLGQ